MPSPAHKPRYCTITGIYSEQLHDIWAKDQRIPSHASRKAWAVARGLNPISVHNWWYRRRPRAKKMRIRIPSGTYELEVGRVPTPPATPPLRVKGEVQEPTICVDPVIEGAGDITKESAEHTQEATAKEADVCGPMEPDSLRFWTDDDELEELRSSMRPSSPFSGSSFSFFPSSDVGEFFQPGLSSATASFTRGFEPAELYGDRNALLARPSSPIPDRDGSTTELDDGFGESERDRHVEATGAHVELMSPSPYLQISGDDIRESRAPVSENTGTFFISELSLFESFISPFLLAFVSVRIL